MKIAYFIYVGKYTENDMFDVCIQSLQKQSNCKIVVYTTELENEELLMSRGVQIIHIDKTLWDNRRMSCKVECTLTLIDTIGMSPGDNVMVFDADLLFLKDPFSVFDNEFDFMYTTRHYTDTYKVNGGVWGFKFNKFSKEFLQYYISNLNNPTWCSYINFRKNHLYNNDLNNLDWWVDQDWLCVCDMHKDDINNGSLGFPITLFDAGPKYNWIIRGGSDEIVEEINTKEKYILHLKGGSFTRWLNGSKNTLDTSYKKYIDLLT